MKLADQVAIVTGGSGAIGAATVKRLGAEGARVVIVSHSRPDQGENLLESLPQGRAIHVTGDLARRGAAEVVVGAATEAFGRLDLLVNVAGATVGAGGIREASEEGWRSAFEVNLFSAVWMSQAALEAIDRERGGQIINISSVRGLEHCGRSAIMAYSAAKAAMISFTKTLAKEVAPAVTVNAIAPGFVWTDNYAAMSADQRQRFIDATPAARFLEVDEIADAVAYLAGTRAVTGEVLTVDGGFALKLG